MFHSKHNLQKLLAFACLSISMFSNAQNANSLQLAVNPCQGSVQALSHEQNGAAIDILFEITINDCEGVCIGSFEYDLLFVDSKGKETRWHLNNTWDWRSVDDKFTLNVHKDIPSDTTLQEISKMEIGRCSCSVPASS